MSRWLPCFDVSAYALLVVSSWPTISGREWTKREFEISRRGQQQDPRVIVKITETQIVFL